MEEVKKKEEEEKKKQEEERKKKQEEERKKREMERKKREEEKKEKQRLAEEERKKPKILFYERLKSMRENEHFIGMVIYLFVGRFESFLISKSVAIIDETDKILFVLNQQVHLTGEKKLVIQYFVAPASGIGRYRELVFPPFILHSSIRQHLRAP